MRAQVALEYLVIAGLLLVMTIPAFWYAFEQSGQALDLRNVKDAAEKITRAADTVYALGPGSCNYVWVRLPNTISEARLANKTVVFTIERPDERDVFGLSRAELVGVLPETPGLHRVRACMLESGKVQIGSAFTVSPDPFFTTIAPGSSNDSLFNVSSNVDYTLSGFVTSVSGSISAWTITEGVDPISGLAAYGWDLFDLNVTVPQGQAAGTYQGTLLVEEDNSEETVELQVTVPQVLSYLNITTWGYGTPVDIGIVVQGTDIQSSERSLINWLESSSSGEGYIWDYHVLSDSDPSAVRNFSATPSWSATDGGSGSSEVETSNDVYADVLVSSGSQGNLTLDFPDLGVDNPPESVNFTAEYKMSAIGDVGGIMDSPIDSMDDVSDWSEEYGAALGSITTDATTKQEGTASMKLSYAFPSAGVGSSEEFADDEEFTGSNDNDYWGGDYDNTWDTDDTGGANLKYFWAGYRKNGGPATRNGWLQLDFDTSGVSGFDKNSLSNISVRADYCHSGDHTVPVCEAGDDLDGTLVGAQLVEIYDYENSEWDTLGAMDVDENTDDEQTERWDITSSLSDYVSGTGNVRIRFEVHTTVWGGRAVIMLLDYVPVTFKWTDSETRQEYVVKKTFSSQNWTDSINITTWVYGDANGEDLTLNITDSGGGSYEWTPLDVNWNGWQQKSFSLSGTSGVDLDNINGVRIKVSETAAGDNPSGTIYIDDLRRYYNDAGGGSFSCSLSCYDGVWNEIESNLASASDTTRTWDISGCIDSVALANDINMKFVCDNSMASPQTFFVDYSNVSASYTSTETWEDFYGVDLCSYRALILSEYTDDPVFNARLVEYMQNCGCLMMTGASAGSGPVGLGYGATGYSATNTTIYITDDSNYITLNYTNNTQLTVYSAPGTIWGSDANGTVLATSAGQTLGESGMLQYYGVLTSSLNTEGNNTFVRFVDHCLNKYFALGTLQRQTTFRANENLIYRMTLLDQSASPIESSDVDSWVWAANGTNLFTSLDKSTSGGVRQETYRVDPGSTGTWTINATASDAYGSAYNLTTFEVVT